MSLLLHICCFTKLKRLTRYRQGVPTPPPLPASRAGPAAAAGGPAAAGSDQAGIRAANLALVTRTVFAATEPPTRADVAHTTAMTRSTVSRLVDDLVGGGLLTELAPVARAGPGRRGTPLVPDGRRFAALGLQVNVGYLAALVVDLAGVVLGRRVVADDLRASSPTDVLGRLADLAAEAVDLAPGPVLVGAGLAVPGLVSPDTGRLLRAPNLGWSEVDVPALLSGRLGDVPLTVGNEADLASRTVSSQRPGRPGRLRDFIYVSGETGVGGAVVLGGTPLAGRHGWAGEIGHLTVDPAGPPCPCGSTGCLEQYAGKRALLAAAGLDPDTTASGLGDRIRAGNARASEAMDRAAWALGCAVAGAVNLVDVPVIVLGGHLREIADLLRPRLEATLRDRVLSARWVPPTIETAGDDPAPGALGAAYLQLERVVSEPAPWLTRPLRARSAPGSGRIAR
jgi:predicted NBD/HSP70 family sugar kinase